MSSTRCVTWTERSQLGFATSSSTVADDPVAIIDRTVPVGFWVSGPRSRLSIGLARAIHESRIQDQCAPVRGQGWNRSLTPTSHRDLYCCTR
ncbi:hypothetical protein HN011_007930 [Eciton burchellii]|nr:hypothetical protein HN011_007930 [Eciton burchellii]